MGSRIVLLGRLAIERGDGPSVDVRPAGRRSEVVFAYLAVEHRRDVSREELADELWPERLPDTWNSALRGVLSDLRRVLERGGLDPAGTLVGRHGSVRLRLPAGAAVDVDEAHAALARAREWFAAGDLAAAAQDAGRAADQAALPFLPQHDGPWAQRVRAQLDRLHIQSLEIQARALAGEGESAAALSAVDRLVRADPFSEPAHRLRIEILGTAGDRAGAVKAYVRYRALLADELGIGPSREIEAALRRVVDTAAAPAATRLGGWSVLVVEERDFQRRTALTLLRGLGVGTLLEAADGAAALRLLEASAPPDVVVCDVDMPGMDGMEFIRNVAQRRLASSVAIASGRDARLLETVRAASEGYGLPVLGVLAKPLTAAALERLLSAYRPPVPAAAAETAADGTALAAAFAAGTLTTVYEPIVDLAHGAVTGVRVTARLPTGDDTPPRGAEEPACLNCQAELDRRLTMHLLQAARDARGALALEAWVNLPSALLADVALPDALAAITRHRVVLVAGATPLAEQPDSASLDLLVRLRLKGFGLCLEPFDGGHPAHARLPLTHAELPAQLVATAAVTGDHARLAHALDAARDVGVPVLGHCATEAEFALLLRLGCSLARGPYLAAPVPASELAQRVRDWDAPTG